MDFRLTLAGQKDRCQHICNPGPSGHSIAIAPHRGGRRKDFLRPRIKSRRDRKQTGSLSLLLMVYDDRN